MTEELTTREEPPPEEPEEDPYIGTVIDDYQVLRRIGGGGMAGIYEAEHVVMGRRVALKVLQARYARHPDTLKRFINEARAAGNLKHPNIVQCTDIGRLDTEAPYLVFELLKGHDLLKEIRRFKRLPVERAARIALQAASALAVAHDHGIVHRDMKPENVFLAPTPDDPDHVKVIDFGVSKFEDWAGSRLTQAGDRLGTACYNAPEQLLDASDVDPRSDVYGLGAVLFEMLTGRMPFVADTDSELAYKVVKEPAQDVRELRPDLPEGIAAVVSRALEKKAADRYASMRELAAALQPFAGEKGHISIPAPPHGRHTAFLVSAAVGLAVIGAVVIWWLY